AGHVVRLRQRVEFDGDLSSALGLENGNRPFAVEVDLGIGGIVTKNHVVAYGEIDRLSKELARGSRRSRVVRVAKPHELRGTRDGLRDRVEIREEVVLLP